MKRDKQYYRDLDKGQLNHTKLMLEKSRGQLKVAIAQRENFGKELMGNGDRAGTGNLYEILEKLEKITDSWEKETELYAV